MANIIPDSFKSELLSGTHNFASGGDSFKIALYVTTIYNDDEGDKLCLVIDFGGNKVATSGDFTIQFPAATAGAAIIRVA